MSEQTAHTEHDLLRQVADGSEAAFRELFHRYRSKLFTYLFRLSKSREEAEDIVHDVFLKIWEIRAQLPGVDQLNAYLYRVAHNRAYVSFQRRAKETLILATLQKEQSGASPFEGEDRIASQEVQQFIRDAVNKLTPQQKQIFLLSRHEGLKHEEIARQLKISVQTVKNHMTDALRALRTEVDTAYGSYAIALFVLHGLS